MRVTIVLALAASLAQADPVQWKVEDGGNGHFYDLVFFERTDTSWFDARAAAASTIFLGSVGHLATITSAAEDAFIKATFAPQLTVQVFGGAVDPRNVAGDFAWIGLSDHEIEQTFQWVTGEPLDFTNWGPFEPGTPADPDQDFVHVRVLHDLRLGTPPAWEWNDLPQELVGRDDVARIGYIVEFDDPVPEPGAIVLLGTAGVMLILRRRQRPSSRP